MADQERRIGDLRLFAMYVGVVKERADPEGLGRVRIGIPGLVDLTAWAWQLGSGGSGSKQNGSKWTPRIGAEVGVFFHQGDPDAPYFFTGNHGKPIVDGTPTTEIPGSNLDPDALSPDGTIDDEIAELTPESSPDVVVFEFRDYLVAVDEREGKGRLLLRHKKTGDHIEHDGLAFGWTIQGTTAIRLVTDGIISLEGATIQINGRKVQDTPNGI